MVLIFERKTIWQEKTTTGNAVHSEVYVKDFFDMVSPTTIKFNVDHFICGDSYRCVWAIKEYPPMTTDQAILSRFGDKEAVTLHMYTRFVDGLEQSKILQNAGRKNKLLANSNDIEDMVIGEGNLGDVSSFSAISVRTVSLFCIALSLSNCLQTVLKSFESFSRMLRWR